MIRFTYYAPTRIVFGFGSLDNLGELVSSLGSRSLVVFSRRFARRYGYVDRIRGLLESLGIKVFIYEGVRPNPPISQCDEIGNLARNYNVDFIVAFGGGSVIDAAKAAAVVAVKGGSIADYFLPKTVNEALPVVAIPTTCGTGSEVTRYAIITNESRKLKLAVVGDAIIPKIAIVDPTVLKHLPRDMMKWTALDAFSHAIEALTSIKSNVISDSLALTALRLIMDNIDDGIKGNDEALSNLHIASTLAGLAINATGTTLLHALGYYLTTHHDVQHGLANAILMPYVLNVNLRAISRKKLDEVAKVLGTEGVEGILSTIRTLLLKLGIPKSLRHVGVKEGELNDYANVVRNYRRNLENNPVKVDEDLLKGILRCAYEGILSRPI